MSFKKLQEEIIQNKIKKGFNHTDIGKEIILMAEELGELARAYRDSNKKPAKEIDNRENIIDAVGDLVVYCLGVFEMLGVDGEEVVSEIVEKNKKRTHRSQI